GATRSTCWRGSLGSSAASTGAVIATGRKAALSSLLLRFIMIVIPLWAVVQCTIITRLRGSLVALAQVRSMQFRCRRIAAARARFRRGGLVGKSSRIQRRLYLGAQISIDQNRRRDVNDIGRRQRNAEAERPASSLACGHPCRPPIPRGALGLDGDRLDSRSAN